MNKQVPTQCIVGQMKACEQMSGLSVLDHGLMVSDYFKDLIGFIRHGTTPTFEWKLPEWISDERLLATLPADSVMEEYHVFHDCGKPACLTVDADGRRHFPDHAAVSKQTWLALGGSQEVADLIGMDMDAHLLKDEGVPEFSKRPQVGALLLTALAEVHANAAMFGGIESVGFKIKWKHLDKRGKAILRAL